MVPRKHDDLLVCPMGTGTAELIPPRESTGRLSAGRLPRLPRPRSTGREPPARSTVATSPGIPPCPSSAASCSCPVTASAPRSWSRSAASSAGSPGARSRSRSRRIWSAAPPTTSTASRWRRRPWRRRRRSAPSCSARSAARSGTTCRSPPSPSAACWRCARSSTYSPTCVRRSSSRRSPMPPRSSASWSRGWTS